MPATAEIVSTPSGIRIAYFDKSHRYKIGRTAEDMSFVPSVSTILDRALPKNLSGWAERIGVEGALAVLEAGTPDARAWTADEVLAAMRDDRLRYWQRRDEAATRGTSVHQAFETLALGQIPKLADYAEHERGYISGVARWWADYEPKVIHAELMVCSWSHKYAGRMDLLAETNRHPGAGVYDLKTSKSVRDSHHFQTAGYRLAVEESGYSTTTVGAIVRVGEDGTYESVESWATPEQFLALHESYLAQKQFEQDTPKEHKRSRKAKAA